MKKGFSLVALAVIVIITLILATSVVIAASSTLNNSKKLAFGNEIKLVQDAVASYKAKNDGQYPIRQNIIFDYSSLKKDFSRLQFTGNNEQIENGKYINLYEIDYEKCGLNNLKYGNGKNGSNDVYAVSIATGAVYYVQGMKIGNDTYFTITDEIKNILNMGWKEENISGIIFEPSTTAWTNQNVDMSIKIPKGYILKEIKSSTNETFIKNDSLSSFDTEYDVYVKIPSNTTATTYDVNVTYAENENTIDKTVSYHVGNIDITGPLIQSAEVSHDTNSISISIAAFDNESGIDTYYFSKDGSSYYEAEENKYVFNNLIENTEYFDICVKVIDKVGNETIRRISDMVEQENLRTDSMGTININGDFVSNESSVIISILYPQITDTERFYKIDNDEWHKVTGLSETLYIEQDCTVYAKVVDSSGQVKETSKIIQRKEK